MIVYQDRLGTNIGKVEGGNETFSVVLSTAPTYNPTTIHTDLADVAAGSYRTYKRHGPL